MKKERKARRTRKIVGAIGVLVTVASLNGCVSSGAKADNTDKEVKKIEFKADRKEVKAEYGIPVSSLVSFIEMEFKGKYDYYNVYYDQNKKTLVMEVTNNGVVLGADKAKKDLSKYNEWLNMTYALNNLSKTVVDTLEENGYYDISAEISVLNDLNKNNILFTSTNGVITYDFIQGINENK